MTKDFQTYADALAIPFFGLAIYYTYKNIIANCKSSPWFIEYVVIVFLLLGFVIDIYFVLYSMFTKKHPYLIKHSVP